jgi:hypothetical protein
MTRSIRRDNGRNKCCDARVTNEDEVSVELGGGGAAWSTLGISEPNLVVFKENVEDFPCILSNAVVHVYNTLIRGVQQTVFLVEALRFVGELIAKTKLQTMSLGRREDWDRAIESGEVVGVDFVIDCVCKHTAICVTRGASGNSLNTDPTWLARGLTERVGVTIRSAGRASGRLLTGSGARRAGEADIRTLRGIRTTWATRVIQGCAFGCPVQLNVRKNKTELTIRSPRLMEDPMEDMSTCKRVKYSNINAWTNSQDISIFWVFRLQTVNKIVPGVILVTVAWVARSSWGWYTTDLSSSNPSIKNSNPGNPSSVASSVGKILKTKKMLEVTEENGEFSKKKKERV